MSKYQRDKGARGERAFVNACKALGFDAERISMMESAGKRKGDVEVELVGWRYNVQVKTRHRIAAVQWLEGHDMLALKQDRGGWYVLLTLEKLAELL